MARWLEGFYGRGGLLKIGEENICITGGASQNLACVLQVFTDPVMSTVWMVAPGYFLAETIFEDSGLRIRCVGEGKGGIDVEGLEKMIQSVEREEGEVKVSEIGNAPFFCFWCWTRVNMAGEVAHILRKKSS